jgi:hypothetical protein
MMFLDYPSMKKWDDREATAKHKQTLLHEEYEEGLRCTDNASNGRHKGNMDACRFQAEESVLQSSLTVLLRPETAKQFLFQ